MSIKKSEIVELKSYILKDDLLKESEKEISLKAIDQNAEKIPPQDDKWVWRIIFISVGIIIITCLICATVLYYKDKDVPEFITSPLTILLGFIIGMLTPSPVPKSS